MNGEPSLIIGDALSMIGDALSMIVDTSFMIDESSLMIVDISLIIGDIPRGQTISRDTSSNLQVFLGVFFGFSQDFSDRRMVLGMYSH